MTKYGDQVYRPGDDLSKYRDMTTVEMREHEQRVKQAFKDVKDK